MRNICRNADDGDFAELSEAFASISDPSEIRKLLMEICSESECCDIALRWRLMKMLASGMTQRRIAESLHMSLCKITRGSRYMKSEDSILRRLVIDAVRKNGGVNGGGEEPGCGSVPQAARNVPDGACGGC